MTAPRQAGRPELVDVRPHGVAAHGGADDDRVVEVEVGQELAEVAAVPRHPLAVRRGLGLPVRAAVEGDGPVPGVEQRVDGEGPRRRGRRVAVDEDDRTPLALVGVGQGDVVGGAEGRHAVEAPGSGWLPSTLAREDPRSHREVLRRTRTAVEWSSPVGSGQAQPERVARRRCRRSATCSSSARSGSFHRGPRTSVTRSSRWYSVLGWMCRTSQVRAWCRACSR